MPPSHTIDSHQHFWHYVPHEYAWIGPHMSVLQRDYLPPDLLPHLKSTGVSGTIAVQARQTLGETRWLLDLAAAYPFIQGVVGWVDLCHPQVEEQIERFAAEPLFCGARHVVQDEPDDGFLLRDEFQRGIEVLGRFDLTYDILIHPRHLEAAQKLVQRFPDQRFVLDHIAKPTIASGALEPWATEIRTLAASPNVACKVSGLVTEAAPQAWNSQDIYPYLDVVFEAFGADRLMFGSDWPVCRLAADSYETVHGLVAQYVKNLTPRERADVFGDTARRVYQLPSIQEP